MRNLFSWPAFVRLLHKPRHPACMAVFRILYGILMLFDLVKERGMGNIVLTWAQPHHCRFPVFDFIVPLPPEWMGILHLLMAIGLVGITLGFYYRRSCLLFWLPFAYIILLDRGAWNNHSHLFLLLGFLLTISDANRCWSLDGHLWPDLYNADVPLWNYYLFRLQIFVLYFVTTIKKLHPDYLNGYSLSLGTSMVFAPLRLFFSADFINLVFVHYSGFVLDLALTFLPIFDKTRPIAFIISTFFHVANIFLFAHLNMFPYVSMASLIMFCHPDMPLHWIRKFPASLRSLIYLHKTMKPSDHCLYTKEAINEAKNVEEGGTSPVKKMKHNPTLWHKLIAIFVVCYSIEELLMPHYTFQGFNHWRSTYPGSSWEMMVHKADTSYAQISYKVKKTGEIGYIAPNSFVSRTHNRRWGIGSITIQLAKCIASSLARDYNITDIELYIHSLQSKNKRFNQRVQKPGVDMLTTDWNVFQPTPWVMPLLEELSHWRPHILRLQRQIESKNRFTKSLFLADFPNLFLRNYVSKEFGNVNLTVLDGKLVVEFLASKRNVSLLKGSHIAIPSEQMHIIHTVSSTPSCFYYEYEDLVEREIDTNATRLSLALQKQQNVNDEKSLGLSPSPEDDRFVRELKLYIKQRRGPSFWEMASEEAPKLARKIRNGVFGVAASFRCIWTSESFSDLMLKWMNEKPPRRVPIFEDYNKSHEIFSRKLGRINSMFY